jgi:hypothetical protein
MVKKRMSKDKVKIFGIERSGTNYIEALLRENVKGLKIYVNCFGWKHGYIQPVDKWYMDEGNVIKEYSKAFKTTDKLDYIMIIKNPYSWHNSIKKWHYQNTQEAFDLDRWFNKYRKLYLHYINHAEKRHKFWRYGTFLRYEDLLKAPKKKTTSVCKFYGWDMRSSFKNPQKVYMSPAFSKERKEYYLSNEFGLKPEEIQRINDLLGNKIFEYFNYAKM